MAKTIKIGNTTFKKMACSTSKNKAKASAKSIRNGGRTARVIKNGKTHCVYAGPRRKKRTGRRR